MVEGLGMMSLEPLIQKSKESKMQQKRYGNSGGGAGNGTSIGVRNCKYFDDRVYRAPRTGRFSMDPNACNMEPNFKLLPPPPPPPPTPELLMKNTAVNRKLHLSNLHFEVTENDIKLALFTDVGPLEYYILHYVKSGGSKGTAEFAFERRLISEFGVDINTPPSRPALKDIGGSSGLNQRFASSAPCGVRDRYRGTSAIYSAPANEESVRTGEWARLKHAPFPIGDLLATYGSSAPPLTDDTKAFQMWDFISPGPQYADWKQCPSPMTDDGKRFQLRGFSSPGPQCADWNQRKFSERSKVDLSAKDIPMYLPDLLMAHPKTKRSHNGDTAALKDYPNLFYDKNCYVTCTEVGESSRAPRNTVSKVAECHTGSKHDREDQGSSDSPQRKRYKLSAASVTNLLGGQVPGTCHQKPAFLWRGGTADDNNVRTSMYFPLDDTTRHLDLGGRDWEIRGYSCDNYMDTWVTFQRGQEIKISSSSGGTAFFPSFPLVFGGKGRMFIQMKKDYGVIALKFMIDGYHVFWQTRYDWGTWLHKRIFQPLHKPRGVIIFKELLLWLNIMDGTLHMLCGFPWPSREAVIRQSYELGEAFIGNEKGKTFCFSPIVAEFESLLYYLKYVELEVGRIALEVKLYRVDIQLGEGSVTACPIYSFGGTMFVCKGTAGFIVKLGYDSLVDKIFFSGYEKTHCVLLPKLSGEEEDDEAGLPGHLFVLRECDKLVNVGSYSSYSLDEPLDEEGSDFDWDADEDDRLSFIDDDGSYAGSDCRCDRLCRGYMANEPFMSFLGIR